MRAMVLERLDPMGESTVPLALTELARPRPSAGQVLVRVTVCGVCHTELDEIAGRTAPASLPVVPGHQVVGMVEETGTGVSHLVVGDRVGVAWIYSACRICSYCTSERENLCGRFVATGRDVNGGYAEYLCVHEDFACKIPDVLDDGAAAPLLCAGAVGYRSLRLASLRNGEALGLTGFGSSGHIVIQLARHLYPLSDVFVFARRKAERLFALELGATWAGDIDEAPPRPLASIIDTTPAWRPVLASLRHLEPGGRLVINAIRKEDRDRHELLNLSYAEHLWQEREVKTVANVTRADVAGMLRLAAELALRPEVREYPLDDANRALLAIRDQEIRGAKVLRIS